MVERVEKDVRFVTNPETVAHMEDMPAEVAEATKTWIGKKIEYGKYEWIPGGGGAPGSYKGLQEKVDSQITSIIGGCGVDCTLRGELLGVSDGDGSACPLELSCSTFSSRDKSLAVEQEQSCLTQQRLGVEAFKDWVVSTTSQIHDQEAKAEQAKRDLDLAQAEIRLLI